MLKRPKKYLKGSSRLKKNPNQTKLATSCLKYPEECRGIKKILRQNRSLIKTQGVTEVGHWLVHQLLKWAKILKGTKQSLKESRRLTKIQDDTEAVVGD